MKRRKVVLSLLLGVMKEWRVVSPTPGAGTVPVPGGH